MQKTIAKEAFCEGIGIHSGGRAKLNIFPAEANAGITFCRKDVQNAPIFRATYDNVSSARNSVVLGTPENGVATIEHLMAAFAALEIDNARVEIDNFEMPVMDGSSAPFVKMLLEAEKVVQEVPRAYLKVLREVRFDDEKNEKYVTLSPFDDGLKIGFYAARPEPIIGEQQMEIVLSEDIFKNSIAPARTPTAFADVEALKAAGLGKGGGLENTLVYDNDRVLNAEGMQENEFVKHKILDVAGDLYTAGYPIIGAFFGYKSGHFHTNELLKRLFADKANYEIVYEK